MSARTPSRPLARAIRTAALGIVLAGCVSGPPGAESGVVERDDATRAHLREVAIAAARARPMTVTDLLQVYEGRTWRWSDGAAYFDPSRRAFESWVRSGPSASYADGAWFLTDTGRMCFRAIWVSVEGSADALTCFDHRIDGERMFQRRAPDGDWYVFAHRPPQAGDEILKFRPGDSVYGNLARNREIVRDALGTR